VKTVQGSRDGGGAQRRPTMKDVAGVAGVSLATVSRVLSGSGEVTPDLAARVHSAVGLLGYRRSVMASSLRRADRLTGSLGVVFEDVGNPFFSSVHRGIEEVARERGVLVLTGSSDDDPQRERELADAFVARAVDGLIVVPSAGDQAYLLREREAGVPLVFIDRPPRLIEGDVVLSDNAGGVREGVDHLIAGGHRRIAFLGDRLGIYTARERLRGFCEALAAHALTHSDELVRTELEAPAPAGAALLELLDAPDPPTALLTAQNLVSIGAIAALRERGLQHRIALVGFDDLALGEMLYPSVTVVAQDPAEIGRRAARLLFDRIDGFTGPAREVVLPTELRVRESSRLGSMADSIERRSG